MTLKTLKHQPIFSLSIGEGTINVAHLFNGQIYVTTENDIESGFSKAFELGPFFDQPVIQVSV